MQSARCRSQNARSLRCAFGILNSALLIAFLPPSAHAQSSPPDRPGPFVVDLRAATIGVPSAAGFYPAVPAGTVVPARALGLDLGAHVFFASLGPARVSVGASVLRVRGKSPQSATVATTTPAAAASGTAQTGAGSFTVSSVEADITGVAPQVSFAFGTRDGWSYLSAGLGEMQIRTKALTSLGTPTHQSGYVAAVNAGAGARWFLTSRMAVGFDVRLYRLSGGRNAATPKTTLVSASGGLSIR